MTRPSPTRPSQTPEPQALHLVVAALARRGEEVLLVCQRGADHPAPCWALPGGVVDPGELLTEALARELREEVGIETPDPGHLLYVAHIDNAGEAPPTLVFVFAVHRSEGDLRPADPDCLVSDARFFPLADAIAHLERLPIPTMREPILAHLRGRARPGTLWLYRRQPDGTDHLTAQLPPPVAP